MEGVRVAVQPSLLAERLLQQGHGLVIGLALEIPLEELVKDGPVLRNGREERRTGAQLQVVGRSEYFTAERSWMPSSASQHSSSLAPRTGWRR